MNKFSWNFQYQTSMTWGTIWNILGMMRYTPSIQGSFFYIFCVCVCFQHYGYSWNCQDMDARSNWPDCFTLDLTFSRSSNQARWRFALSKCFLFNLSSQSCWRNNNECTHISITNHAYIHVFYLVVSWHSGLVYRREVVNPRHQTP